MLKSDGLIKQLTEEQKAIKGERDLYQEEIDRLRTQADPNSMSLADI